MLFVLVLCLVFLMVLFSLLLVWFGFYVFNYSCLFYCWCGLEWFTFDACLWYWCLTYNNCYGWFMICDLLFAAKLVLTYFICFSCVLCCDLRLEFGLL